MTTPKFLPVLLSLSFAFVLSGAPAFAGSGETKSPLLTQEVSDALQGLAVRAKLVDKLGLDALRISVHVNGSRATLTGDVPKKATQELARDVALSVKGIDEVDNHVKESIPTGTMLNAKSELKDAALEIKVKSVLLEEIGANALDITVESTDGVVSLRGILTSHEIAKAAAERVRKIDGVKQVVNLLSV